MFLKTYNFFKCSFPSNAKNIVVFKISEARLYCKIVENEEPKITKSLAKDCSLRDKAKVLYKLFDIRLLHAMDIISRYKCYQTTPVQIITKNFELVKREGIPTKTIMRYPEVIGQNNLELKLELLKKLPCDVHKTYPLLNVTLNVADKFFNQESLARIQFYSRLFKVYFYYILAKLNKFLIDTYFVLAVHSRNVRCYSKEAVPVEKQYRNDREEV